MLRGKTRRQSVLRRKASRISGTGQSWMTPQDGAEARAYAIAAMSKMVGAVLLSRSVNDPAMAGQFLQAAADRIMPDAEHAPEAKAKS